MGRKSSHVPARESPRAQPVTKVRNEAGPRETVAVRREFGPEARTGAEARAGREARAGPEARAGREAHTGIGAAAPAGPDRRASARGRHRADGDARRRGDRGGPGDGGTVTARKAGGLRDMALEVDPRKVGVKAALQHLAKAVNIAFQTDYGENYLESVYQAAIVRNGELQIVHREYFGFRDTWFSQFGKLIRSLQLTLEGPDPASPEGQKRIAEKGAGDDPGPPQPARPQARPGRRVRGPRPRLRRADVRPPRSLGHHRRLGPRRLGDLDHQIGLDIHIAPRDEVPPGLADQLEEAP